jgi:hypothetical protein
MDPLSTLKKIRKIIRTTTDREVVKLILDLQKEVFAIESHNLEFASELTASNNSWTCRRGCILVHRPITTFSVGTTFLSVRMLGVP